MTSPATRLPGQVQTGAGFTGGGGVAIAGTGEWVDMLPPDDATPIALTFTLLGDGPGTLRVFRAPPGGGGTPTATHVAPVNIPAGPLTEEVTLTFLRPIPNGALRVTYENLGGAEVFPGLSWAYVAPGRRQ